MKLKYQIAQQLHRCDACRRDITPGVEYVRFQWNGETRKVHAGGVCEVNHPALSGLFDDDDAAGAK